MKNKYISMLILIFYIGILFSSPVSDEIILLSTETELSNFYQNSDNYTRRYILKHLPEWMENRGISDPSSFYSIIENAVLAENCYLVEEAIILVGKYQIESSFDEMEVLYENVMNKFPQYGNYIRMAIISALMRAPDEIRKNYLASLLNYRPTSFFQSEFSGLVYAASQYCDHTVIPRLNEFKAEISADAVELEQSDPEKYGRYEERYDTAINELDEAIISINERSE